MGRPGVSEFLSLSWRWAVNVEEGASGSRLPLARRGRDLGADMAYGLKRSTVVQNARIARFLDGTRQVAALHVPSALRGAAVLVKYIPMVNFGAEVTGLSRTKLHQLRQATMRSIYIF